MATIHNQELIQSLIDKAKLQTAVDKVPTQLAEKIVPVLIAGTAERLIKVASITASNATSATILTTSSTKDTYLIGANISVTKDIVNDGSASFIRCYPFGDAIRSILTLNYQPTTLGDFNEVIQFALPIKLEKGTTIIVGNGAATAVIDATGTIFYYEVSD